MTKLRRGPMLAAAAVTAVWLSGGCGSSSGAGPGPEDQAGAAGGPGKAVRPGVAGIAFTEVLIDLMNNDLVSFGGWRPNDLLFGKIFDDRTNEELGHLAVVRQSVEILKEDLARRGALDDFNPELAKAEAAFDSDPYKWRPSAGSRMEEGVADLKGYRDQLIQGQAGFFPRPENLAHLLDHDVTLLGDLHHRLLAPVGYFKTDNEFYYSRGAAAGLARLYASMESDFAPELEARGIKKLIEEARASLELAAQMHPWIVLDGGDDSIRANHRLNMAAHLAEARTKSFLALESLKQPLPQ